MPDIAEHISKELDLGPREQKLARKQKGELGQKKDSMHSLADYKTSPADMYDIRLGAICKK